MQMVRPLIGAEFNDPPVERKPGASDAVGETSAGRAEICSARDIPLEAVMPEHDVAQLAVPVRHMQRQDPRAILGERQIDVRAAQPEAAHRLLADPTMVKNLDRHPAPPCGSLSNLSDSVRMISQDQGRRQ
jgi:hypothetical protein